MRFLKGGKFGGREIEKFETNSLQRKSGVVEWKKRKEKEIKGVAKESKKRRGENGVAAKRWLSEEFETEHITL